MAHPKFITAGEFKFFLYRSKAKIESFYEQIRAPKTQTKLKWKIDLRVFSMERETETDDEPSLDEKLKAVIAALEEQQLVGLLEDQKPYIKGIFPMRWGIYNDHGFRLDNEGPLVYFSGLQDKVLLGLGGSSVHIEGCYGLTSTSSRSSTRALASWLRTGLENGEAPPIYREDVRDEHGEVSGAMALANHYLKGPVQDLEFVAKVLLRYDWARLTPWDSENRGEAILATPLYISQVDPMVEDDDYQDKKTDK